MSQSRTCTQCGTAIVGRSDKHYCSDTYRHLANNVVKQKNQFRAAGHSNTTILNGLSI